MMSNEFIFNREILENIKVETVELVKKAFNNDLKAIILYGSCARGDYNQDSDIDIALLTNCNRMNSKKYSDELARIARAMAMKYFVVVNFVCIPFEEFLEKRGWYAFFRNINMEGIILYDSET